SDAVMTRKPSRSRYVLTRETIFGSSSTTRIGTAIWVSIVGGTLRRQCDVHLKPRYSQQRTNPDGGGHGQGDSRHEVSRRDGRQPRGAQRPPARGDRAQAPDRSGGRAAAKPSARGRGDDRLPLRRFIRSEERRVGKECRSR